MKKIILAKLLDNLQADTREIILQTNRLLTKDPELLLQQPGEGKWSIAQIIEHLNSYGRYYLPLIEKSLTNVKATPTQFFTPGWLGNYFAKSMLPNKQGYVTNKMKAPKNHRPAIDIDSRMVINEFLAQGQLLLRLLDKAGTTDLEKIKIPISISRFIKINLGDTFRFLIAHHQRHFVQLRNTWEAVSLSRRNETIMVAGF
jgi:hypothetical protein